MVLVLANGTGGRAQPPPSPPAPASLGAVPPGTCAPAVLIEGDPALVPAIAAALLSRGLGPATDDGCPVTRVLVQRRDPHIAVLLRDEIRSTERQVIDRETAVSLIESWVRSDLSAPLLLGSIAALPPSSMSQSPDSPPSTTWDARGTVSLHGLFAMDVAGRPWMGAGLRGCARVFRLCIGGAWQTLGQLTLSGEDGRRVVTELFAIVALPARVGRAWLWPSLGLGVSWLHVSTRLLLRDGEGDPIELEPEDTIAVNASTVAASADQGHLQAEARLGLVIPLRYGLSLGLAAALDATLTPRTAPLLMGPLSSTGESSTGVVQLTTPPWGMVLGQLGLQWSPR